MSAAYKLELVTGEVDRTTWWKDENHKEPAGVWWLTGGGLSRPATDVEIEFWKMAATPCGLAHVETI